jgi:hypothetical protein
MYDKEIHVLGINETNLTTNVQLNNKPTHTIYKKQLNGNRTLIYHIYLESTGTHKGSGLGFIVHEAFNNYSVRKHMHLYRSIQ